MRTTVTHLTESISSSVLIANIPAGASVEGAVYVTSEANVTGMWRISGDGSAIDNYGNPHGAETTVSLIGGQLVFNAGTLTGSNYLLSGFVNITQ